MKNRDQEKGEIEETNKNKYSGTISDRRGKLERRGNRN
jgi:hypothetical protein